MKKVNITKGDTICFTNIYKSGKLDFKKIQVSFFSLNAIFLTTLIIGKYKTYLLYLQQGMTGSHIG